MPRHEHEEIELLGREPHFGAADVHAARVEIDAKIAGVERRDIGVAVRAPERRPHAREQLVDAERFGDVVVGARIERLHLRPLLAFDRQHDDRDVRHGADPLAQLDAVHVRHVRGP